MNLPLSDAMQQWVDGQTETGRYPDAGAYVRALIESDQERARKIGAMSRLIEEAEASGVSTRTIEEIFEDVRERVSSGSHAV